jgi:hypothetical protein
VCVTIRPDSPPMAQPRWGLLYGATLCPLAALAIVEVAAPPNPLRTALRAVLTLATFATMGAWVWSSRAVLDLQDWCPCAPATISVRVIESSRPRLDPLPADLDPLAAWSESSELIHH